MGMYSVSEFSSWTHGQIDHNGIPLCISWVFRDGLHRKLLAHPFEASLSPIDNDQIGAEKGSLSGHFHFSLDNRRQGEILSCFLGE